MMSLPKRLTPSFIILTTAVVSLILTSCGPGVDRSNRLLISVRLAGCNSMVPAKASSGSKAGSISEE